MEGNVVKRFLSNIERTNPTLLKLITRFRIVERGGKVILYTDNGDLKSKLENLLRTTLSDSLANSVVVALDKESCSEQTQESNSRGEGLNGRFSFTNFVVGEGNRLAYEVALEVASSPGRMYNPLFIYGGVGLGKTHLLQAIGNECARKNYKVVYRSATDFSEEMVEAIKTGRIKDFRSKYREVDILLIDDVQFLSGKERTQIEFFNIFNHMFLNDRQIVLASDRHPKELKDISDRLISRFEGGIIVEICMDELTKLEIIKCKLKELKVEIQDRIVKLIMEQTSNNVRDIEGTIRGIKLKGIEHLKKKSFQKNELDRIRIYTALHFGIDPEELLQSGRSKKINRIRHIAFYLCKRLTDASLIEIARAFNRKDHSTVIYGIKKIEEERRKNRKLNYIISFLEKHIGNRL